MKSEIAAHTASSQQEKRLFATRRYNIETAIGKNDHLFSRATITYEPLVPGERVSTKTYNFVLDRKPKKVALSPTRKFWSR